MDVVHAHASDNSIDGLNGFDGTPTYMFHEGELGWHAQWGTRMFDFGKYETLRFLLSNLSYWTEEMHFDGFRWGLGGLIPFFCCTSSLPPNTLIS